jgi:hypothetical protein
MSKQEKRAYLMAIWSRYAASSRPQKAVILNEYCISAELGRKYAINQLARLRRSDWTESCPQGQPERSPLSRSRGAPVGNSPMPIQRSGRKPVYATDSAVFAAIEAIWRAANKPCSKRLVATLPLWLKYYEQAHGALSALSRARVKAISAASIDRLLRATRGAEREALRGLSGTVPATEYLRGLIPVRTHFKGVDRPGCIEADTVAHCGSSINGEFFWTLTCTDIFSGWTECAPVWSKLAANVVGAVQGAQTRLPFKLQAFDTDNGSEFINYPLQHYCHNQRPPINFTRSRPYEKNDQAHVEQKNYTAVRQYLGYTRIDNPALEEAISTLFTGSWRDYVNFFLPTLKLIKKQYVGTRVRRIYEPIAQTPYERLMASRYGVSSKTKAALKAHFLSLNPFTLKLDLDAKLAYILNNARCTEL